MKVAAAQIRTTPGDLVQNFEQHVQFIQLALGHSADMLFFPELSLPGYITGEISNLDHELQDELLNKIGELTRSTSLLTGTGYVDGINPNFIGSRITLSSEADVYHKHHLHADELPFFAPGKHISTILQEKKVALIICYEVQKTEYVKKMCNGMSMLVTSVAKTEEDASSTHNRMQDFCSSLGIPGLLINGVGESEGFRNGGQSACWNARGDVLAMLDSEEEGMIVYDRETDEINIL